MSNDKLSLTLFICGDSYPLVIDRSEEQAFRQASKILDNRINQYRNLYGGSSGLSNQNFAVMAALQALVENFSLSEANNTKPFEDKISLIIKELDAYLKK